MVKDLLKLLVISIFFTIVVFFIKTTIFTDKQEFLEEKYIDPVIERPVKNTNSDLLKQLKQKSENNLNSASKYYFVYIPSTIKDKMIVFKNDIKKYIDNTNINKFISDLRINFYKESTDRRGKMKNKTVKIFDAQKMGEQETLSIFIHEFSHYIDLYYLDFKNNKDLSNKFYNISWLTTKTLKSGQSQADFVSGYAMTNKYEDFAESLTYYIVSNKDFLEKSEKSEILQEKYNFFANNLFCNGFFKNTKFSTNLIIRDYYRDITKIKIDLKKFLQYLQN